MAAPRERPTDEIASILVELPALRTGRQARLADRAARRIQVLTLLLSGMSRAAVAERLDMSEDEVRNALTQALKPTEQAKVAELRALENARLDRAQEAIWEQVCAGDLKAVDVYLRLSKRRSQLNGLDAPQKVEVTAVVRQEMETALRELEALVLGPPVIDVDPVFDEEAPGG